APTMLTPPPLLPGGELMPRAADELEQLAVDGREGAPPHGRGVLEELDESTADEHVLIERDRALLGRDLVGAAADRLQPVAELLRLRHRRSERDHPDVSRQVEAALPPDRAALPVGEEVHLVEHDDREAAEQRGVRIEH